MSEPQTRQLLTRRQRSVLRYLRRHFRTYGYAPSNAEIADECDLGAPSGAHRIVSVLEDRGYLRRRDGRSRALQLCYPPTGELQEGSDALFVMTAITSFQRAVRGRLVATLQQPDLNDDAIAALMADASARNDFLRRHSIDKADESTALRADSFNDLLNQLSQRTTWPEFVVDHAVFNAGSIAGSDQLIASLPDLEPALLDVIDMSANALRQCRSWLAGILESGRGDMVELQRRILLMEHVSKLVANIVTEQLGRKERLGADWGNDSLLRLLRAADGGAK